MGLKAGSPYKDGYLNTLHHCNYFYELEVFSSE